MSQASLQNDLVIRAAEPRDSAGLAALANLPDFRAGTLRLPYQSEEETRKWLAGGDAQAINLVALMNGTIVGSGGLTPRSGRRRHTAGVGLGVHDAYRRQGIGETLLRALVEAADDWLGLTRLELTVYADNAAAIGLYEKFGFEREGLHRAFALRAGRYVDALAMARLRRPAGEVL